MLSKIQMAETVNPDSFSHLGCENLLVYSHMAENCRNFARKRSVVSRIIKKRSTIAAFNIYF